MEEVVAHLKKYVDTYANQPGYEEYSDELLIEDILYGLGAAIDQEYRFARGFVKFRKRLLEKLQKEVGNE